MPRNKSEKAPPHQAELITFAHVCEQDGYISNSETGYLLGELYDGLSFEAREELNEHSQSSRYRHYADYIFEKYGRDDGTKQK